MAEGKQMKREASRLFSGLALGAAGAFLVSALLLCAWTGLSLTLGGGQTAGWPLAVIGVVSGLVGGLLAAGRVGCLRLPVALGAAVIWAVVWLCIGQLAYGAGSVTVLAARLAAGLTGGLLAGFFSAHWG